MTNFLEKFDYYELSYNICKNPNQKFSLAIKLKKLKDAKFLAEEQNSTEKWKIVADLAMELGEFSQAEEAMISAKDYNGLLLYYSCICDKEKLALLAANSENDGFYNVSFSCYYQLNDLEKCLEVLLKSNKISEAALFCRTYYPSKLNSILELWNNEINNQSVNSRIDVKVINPLENFNSTTIAELEQIGHQYYDLVRTSHLDDTYKLLGFNEFDLENYYNENGNANIDLKELLNIK